MKYLKLFEEHQPDRTEELLDFTNDYLAYLTDEGFKFQVNFGDFSSDVYETIRIRKGENPFFMGGDTNLDKESFTWNQIKDYMLPYLIMLDRRYTIDVVTFFTERLGSSLSYTRQGLLRVKDLLEEEKVPDFQVDRRGKAFDEIRIKVLRAPISKIEERFDRFLSGEKDQINESMSHQEEIKDFCDTHLAYLTDENFRIVYEEFYGGHMTTITLRLDWIETTSAFSWEEVKDSFIPFLHMLSKEYPLFSFHFEDFDCKKDEKVCFYTFMGTKYYYTYEDVISDKIDTSQFYKRNGLFSIMLKIGRKLNP